MDGEKEGKIIGNEKKSRRWKENTLQCQTVERKTEKMIRKKGKGYRCRRWNERNKRSKEKK